ncbi:hypothetical protein CB1_020447003 [Camelus ferus]|nr:hypothetical protein CB1_020447003 [Camelus ferus]
MLANHTGYIKVDWQRVEKDMKKAKEQLKIRKSNQIPTEVKSKAEEVVSFVKKNVLDTQSLLLLFSRAFIPAMAYLLVQASFLVTGPDLDYQQQDSGGSGLLHLVFRYLVQERSDPKFTYTGTEMRTVAEKVDTVRIVHIHSVIILRRSDKRKDRVEISPEQLSAASTEAEISFLVDETVFCALEAPLSFVCCFRRFHRFSSW